MGAKVKATATLWGKAVKIGKNKNEKDWTCGKKKTRLNDKESEIKKNALWETTKNEEGTKWGKGARLRQ